MLLVVQPSSGLQAVVPRRRLPGFYHQRTAARAVRPRAVPDDIHLLATAPSFLFFVLQAD